MLEIVVDTETTGLTRLSFANRLNYQQWPRIVQIAWALIDDEAIVDRQSFIIKPVGYTIPASSTQIHGISQQKGTEYGIPIRHALHDLNETCAKCKRIIAHNIHFDIGVITSEAMRSDFPIQLPAGHTCTMNLGRQYLVKSKGTNNGGFPRLSQLYEVLFGFGYSRQHDAASDVLACFHVYKKLRSLGFIG